MSDLDTKLYEILYNDVFLALESGYAGGPSVTQKDIKEEAAILIAQIKQAFSEAGWIDTKKPITGPIHGVGVYEVDTGLTETKEDK